MRLNRENGIVICSELEWEVMQDRKIEMREIARVPLETGVIGGFLGSGVARVYVTERIGEELTRLLESYVHDDVDIDGLLEYVREKVGELV